MISEPRTPLGQRIMLASFVLGRQHRTSMIDPQNVTTAYGYDILNRLGTLTYNNQTPNFVFGYDALSRRNSLTRPNAVDTTYGYDPVSRLTSILHKLGTTTLDGASYTYDGAGNRLTRTDKRLSTTLTYGYDNIYQLKTAKQGTTTKESYTYDLVGNRLSSLNVSPYNYNTSNELTSTPSGSYTYDNNGNRKTDPSGAQYTWDLDNRLTQEVLPGTGGTVNFKYDPFGRRVQKAFTQNGTTTTTDYLYDGANILETTDQSGNVLARYVESLNIDEHLSEIVSGTTSYYEQDGLGSASSLSNSSGALAKTYTYDSYGKLTASTGTLSNPFQYTGREFDSETGIHYYRARYYDTSVGRFLSEDPIRFAGSGSDFYAYVGNDPADFADPLGLRPLTDCEKRKLAPYIPKIDLDNADVHPGEVPWYFRFVSKDFEGITRGNDIYFRPGVYDPSTVEGLATLGHELVHVGQYRNGMTWLQYMWASRHGYDKNPYEGPAYDKQDEIQNTMTKEKCGGCPKQ